MRRRSSELEMGVLRSSLEPAPGAGAAGLCQRSPTPNGASPLPNSPRQPRVWPPCRCARRVRLVRGEGRGVSTEYEGGGGGGGGVLAAAAFPRPAARRAACFSACWCPCRGAPGLPPCGTRSTHRTRRPRTRLHLPHPPRARLTGARCRRRCRHWRRRMQRCGARWRGCARRWRGARRKTAARIGRRRRRTTLAQVYYGGEGEGGAGGGGGVRSGEGEGGAGGGGGVRSPPPRSLVLSGHAASFTPY